MYNKTERVCAIYIDAFCINENAFKLDIMYI